MFSSTHDTAYMQDGTVRRRRTWLWMLLVLIAAQFALLLHQFEHHTHFEVTTTEDCALCSFASGMAAAPPTQSIAIPLFTSALILFAAFTDTLTPRPAALGFFARGPPAPLSA